MFKASGTMPPGEVSVSFPVLPVVPTHSQSPNSDSSVGLRRSPSGFFYDEGSKFVCRQEAMRAEKAVDLVLPPGTPRETKKRLAPEPVVNASVAEHPANRRRSIVLEEELRKSTTESPYFEGNPYFQ
ncbi:hypothetical protein JYT19_00865 [Sulfobacillus acidophilus]|uniref:Uncharacterized protein n=1 Tax=Sulfobacillus acidophilus TaxID=53633 RepID=A0ABS3B0R9_9FIRM|nr:hypothetical protein [Sulfobacillus acidophilus]